MVVGVRGYRQGGPVEAGICWCENCRSRRTDRSPMLAMRRGWAQDYRHEPLLVISVESVRVHAIVDDCLSSKGAESLCAC